MRAALRFILRAFAGARGVFGGFNPLRGAAAGVVIRRRATSGEMARGGGVLEGLIRCAGRPQEWSCGAVPPQERWHEGGCFGGFNPLRGAAAGVVIRRRATSGEMARGGLVFVFSLEVAPVSEGDSFTRSGEMARGVGVCFLAWGIVSHAREWPFGAVTPLGRRDPALRRGRRGLMRFLEQRREERVFSGKLSGGRIFAL